MADNKLTGPVNKSEKPVSKLPGPASKTIEKGKSPKLKLSAVIDVTKEVETLKKTSKELKQSNVELKLQLVQQEERFSNQLAQQGTQLDDKFS